MIIESIVNNLILYYSSMDNRNNNNQEKLVKPEAGFDYPVAPGEMQASPLQAETINIATSGLSTSQL